jgi:hypothetical protein
LAPFGLDRNHVDAVFRSEMGHRQYADKWMKSIESDAEARPQSAQKEEEPRMDGQDSISAKDSDLTTMQLDRISNQGASG